VYCWAGVRFVVRAARGFLRAFISALGGFPRYRQRLKELRVTGQSNNLKRIEVLIPDIVAVLMIALSTETGVTQKALIQDHESAETN
jgi:hypothetical protein